MCIFSSITKPVLQKERTSENEASISKCLSRDTFVVQEKPEGRP